MVDFTATANSMAGHGRIDSVIFDSIQEKYFFVEIFSVAQLKFGI